MDTGSTPQIPSAPKSTEQWRHFGDGYLPGLLGLEFGEITRGRVTSRLTVRREHMAPNGYLHAATVIALADTSCGYGTFASLPDGARGFTTIELKANFLNTVREGALSLRGHTGPRRPDHPGLGRAGHGRIERPRHRAVPLHAAPALPVLIVPIVGRPHGRRAQRATAVPVAAASSTARAMRRACTASSGAMAGVARPRTQSMKWRSSK